MKMDPQLLRRYVLIKELIDNSYDVLRSGEGAGTWGDTTNTNLGTLLEQAISGYATESLTTGTTLTLTIPNGATGVARNMYLEFTGNGSTVIVPSNKKLYFVYNNCSSGTITMKVAGQTGVTVANGAKQILVSNGTDIQQAITAGVDGITTSTVTALGVNAGDSVTSGTETTAVGYNAGTAVNSGAGNSCFGHDAGKAITTGSSNTAVGANALETCTTNSLNTCIGYNAGRQLTTGGFSNTCIGAYAGEGLTTGELNTIIGTEANAGSAGASTRIVIGRQVVGTENSRITIGNYTNSAELDLDGSDTSWAASSDERLKENIQTSNIGLDLIMSLRPVSYQWRKGKDVDPAVPGHVPEYNADGSYNPKSDERVHGEGDIVYLGFVAQEAEAAIAANNADVMRMVKQRENGIYTVAPATLIPALVKAIQELKAELDAAKLKIAALETK